MTDIFSLILVFLLCVSCSSEKKTVETAYTDPQKTEIPDNMIWDMDVTITNSGKLKAKFKAGFAEREAIGSSKYFESKIDSGLIIEFYEDNEITGVLTSKKGKINDLKEIYTAMENVVFHSNKGYVLYTDTLYWDRKKAEIMTESDVMMVKDSRDTLYGDGFITDDKFLSYEIRNPKGEAFIDKQKISE